MSVNYIDARCSHGNCERRNHYVVMGRCQNCDWEGYVWIRNGHVKAEASSVATCPRCECKMIRMGEFVAGNGFEGEQ